MVERPFVPEDLEAIEKKMKELAARDLPYERADVAARRGAAASSRDHGEPLKVQLIEEKTAGQAEVSCYTTGGRETFVDFCVGPHVPSSGTAQGVQAADDLERVLEGRRAQPADAARLRDRVRERSELKAHLQRIEEAKKRDHRKLGKDLGLFMFHQWAPGATFWLSKGTTLYNLLADYMREVLIPGRLRRGQGAARLQQGALGDVRPLAALPPEHVPGRESEGEQMGLKAMNCPGHMLVFAERGPQLPRSADPAARADAAAPQRSVGRAHGPDARPAVLARTTRTAS